MATPLHKNPCPGGHEIYNFGRPFLGHYYYTLSLYGLCPRVEKKIFFSEIHQFYTLLPQNYFPLGLRAMKFTISCRLTLKMLHTKFGQDWPSN